MKVIFFTAIFVQLKKNSVYLTLQQTLLFGFEGVPPNRQMAPSWEHSSGVNLRRAPFCRFLLHLWGLGLGHKKRVGERKPNKQVSLRLHRMFHQRHQNRDDRWIINIAYITMKRRTNSQALSNMLTANISGFFIHVFKNIWTFASLLR